MVMTGQDLASHPKQAQGGLAANSVGGQDASVNRDPSGAYYGPPQTNTLGERGY